jgi:CRP-like cAMP-binding protein
MKRSSRPQLRLPHSRTSCFECQSRNRAEWCQLDASDLAVLDRNKVSTHYEPGQTLYRQGDTCAGVYIVERGTVAERRDDAQGNSAVIRLRHAGDTLGYRDYFTGNTCSNSAVALADCSICFIPRHSVRALLDRNPSLGLRFLRRLADDLTSAEDTILRNVALPMRQRLVHLLLTLKDHYGEMGEDGVLRMELPLARQEIASILGSRPETITRTIHGLEEDGVAVFSGRAVIVADLDKLLDELEADTAV